MARQLASYSDAPKVLGSWINRQSIISEGESSMGDEDPPSFAIA